MDFNLATNEQLQRWINERKAQIAEMQADINREQKVIDDYEAELARRQLAAYLLAHPELTAVAVGDRLLITDDFKANRENYGGIQSWLHTDIEVSDLYIDDGMIKCSLKGRIGDRGVVGVGSIPLEIVSGMRRAYIEWSATWRSKPFELTNESEADE